MVRHASYADVLHRLSLGEEMSGAELHSLPGYDPRPDMVFAVLDNPFYSASEVPHLLLTAARLAAEVVDVAPGLDPVGAVRAINQELEDCGIRPQTEMPELVRNVLWAVGGYADMAIKLKGL